MFFLRWPQRSSADKPKERGGGNCCLLAAEESKEHLASDSGSVSCWFFDSGIFSSSWLGVADIPIGFSLPTEIKILKDVILSKSLVFSQKTHHMFSYASLSFAIVSISMPSQIFSLCITQLPENDFLFLAAGWHE